MSRTKRWLEELQEKELDELYKYVSKWQESSKLPQNLNEFVLYLRKLRVEIEKTTYEQIYEEHEAEIISQCIDYVVSRYKKENQSNSLYKFLTSKNEVYNSELDAQIQELIEFCTEEDDGYYQHFEYIFKEIYASLCNNESHNPWLLKPGSIDSHLKMKDMYWVNLVKLCYKSSDIEKLKIDLNRGYRGIPSALYFSQIILKHKTENIKSLLLGINFYEIMILFFMNIISLEDLNWAFKHIYSETSKSGYQTNLFAYSILSFVTQMSNWKNNSALHYLPGFKTPLSKLQFEWLHEQVQVAEDLYKNYSKIAIPDFKKMLFKEYAKAIDVICPYEKDEKEYLATGIAIQVI
jgi:hypothetical protein